MSDVTTIEVTDKVENEDGTTTEEKWNAYRFRDTGVNFSEKYILPDQELRIRFASGLLNGLEFAVKFNPEGKPEKLEDGGWNPEAQLWEIVRNEDYGRPLPGDVLFPQDGDEYVLSGWDSTKITELGLVGAAEQELKEKTEKYAAKSKIDPSTYGCTMMSNDAYREDGVHNFYSIGQKVNLINKAYFENGRQSRVIGFEFNLDYSFDSPVYTVGETAAYSRIGELEEKVESLTLKGQTYTGDGGSGVYVIGSHDSTPATDHNVYSALRSLVMFLRKDQADGTNFLLKFGKFIDSMIAGKGAGIYPDGRGQFERLEVRGSAVFKEIIRFGQGGFQRCAIAGVFVGNRGHAVSIQAAQCNAGILFLGVCMVQHAKGNAQHNHHGNQHKKGQHFLCVHWLLSPKVSAALEISTAAAHQSDGNTGHDKGQRHHDGKQQAKQHGGLGRYRQGFGAHTLAVNHHTVFFAGHPVHGTC